MRRVAVHFWPADQNAPAYDASTARPRSASASTSSGLCPPSSSWTRLPSRVASSRTECPVATEPVNEIARTRVSWTSAAPTVEPRPVSTFSTPARQLRLRERLGDVQAGARRLVGELQDDGVAVDERGRELPDRDRDREVPRRDQRDDADGPAARRHLRAGRRLLEVLADRAERLARGVAQDLRGAARLAARLAQRLAHLGAHVDRDLLDARLEHRRGRRRDTPRGAPSAARPSRRMRPRPRRRPPSASASLDEENSPTVSAGRIGFTFVYVSPEAAGTHAPPT